jgi:AcrR family transcriptional regulator
MVRVAEAAATTQPSAGKRARNQAARRQRVIEAAMALATEGGYDAVQMRDVASTADVALGTLYRYFPSKDHLLIAAQEDWARALKQRLTQKPPRGDRPADRVVDVLRRASRALERAPRLTAALVTAMSSADPAVAIDKQGVANIMDSMIRDAIGDEHNGDADLDGILRVLQHVWFASLVSWAGGIAELTQMGDDLELAARLLLRDRVAAEV